MVASLSSYLRRYLVFSYVFRTDHVLSRLVRRVTVASLAICSLFLRYLRVRPVRLAFSVVPSDEIMCSFASVVLLRQRRFNFVAFVEPGQLRQR